MRRDTAFLAEIIKFGFDPQEEVSLMSFTLQLSSFTRKQLYRRLQEAYASGSLKLVKRIHALLALAQGQTLSQQLAAAVVAAAASCFVLWVRRQG